MIRSHRPDERGAPLPDEVVELRVHGVGGAPPEEVLDVPATRLVAGDETAGFFRSWGSPESPPREAFAWGGLTSASRLRALWVLLTPFALTNLAGWMFRHGGEPTDTDRRERDGLEAFAAAVVRAFGLVMTMAAAAYVSMGWIDLVAYQCGARTDCAAGRWWMWPWDNRFVIGHPDRALAVGVAAALFSVLALAWIARRSQIAIHRRRASFAPSGDPMFELNLNHSELWDSPHVAHRLGLLHTTAAIVVVAVGAAGPLGRVSDEVAWLPLVGWALLAVSLAVVLRLDGVPPRVHSALLVAAGAYTVAVVAAVLSSPAMTFEDGPLPGSGAVAAALAPTYALGLLAAGGAAYWLWRRHPHGRLRVAMAGTGLLLASVGMVNAFGSGVMIRLADLLGGAAAASDPVEPATDAPAIVYADWVSDVAVITVFALVVVVTVAVVTWARAGRGPSCSDLARRYAERGGLDCSDPEDRAWADRVGRAEALAPITDRAAAVLGTSAVMVTVGIAAAVLSSDDPRGLGLGSWADPLAAPASVVLGAIPLVAVVGMSQLYRNRSVRRVIGILWDVATFWPRWFHPWSPPSYGERVVPQLSERVTALATGPGVVVAAHSQGSVLAVGAVCQVDLGDRDRVALLTHGSPLARFYGRYFPEYFSSELFTFVSKDLAGWVNLWRPTDFIGGPIDAWRVDDRSVFDPPSSRPCVAGDPRPLPLRHSHYERTPEYLAAREGLVSALG